MSWGRVHHLSSKKTEKQKNELAAFWKNKSHLNFPSFQVDSKPLTVSYSIHLDLKNRINATHRVFLIFLNSFRVVGRKT